MLKVKTIIEYADVFKKQAGRWGSIIKGEWWIDPYGQAMYADQDVGDVGHETIAADGLLNKDVLLDGLREYYKKELDSGEIDEFQYKTNLDRLDEYEPDDYGAAAIFYNEQIPEEVGIMAAGDAQKWHDINKDVRLAYSKYEGAILVINTNFAAWSVTEQTISAIQNFLWEQIQGNVEGENAPLDEDILVEEIKTRRHVSMPLNEFLEIKYPNQLWRK